MTKTFLVGMTLLFVVLGMAGAVGAVEIAGIVVDDAGKPVADAKIAVLGQDLKAYGKIQNKGEAKSGQDGKFVLTLTDAGTDVQGLQLAATHPQYGLSIQDREDLPLKGKSLSGYRIVMAKRGFIQGKVVDDADKPVKDAEITVSLTKKTGSGLRSLSIQRPDKSILSAKTGEDGIFKLDGLPQDVTAVVRVMHPDYTIGMAGLASDQRNPMGTIAIGSSDTLVKLQAGATVEGKVAWEGTGAPVAKVLVKAYPEKMTQAASFGISFPTETDDKGVFVMKGLIPGKCTLRVMSSAFKDGIITPRTLEVAQGVKLTGQNLTATRGVLIAGKFVNVDTKEPVAEAHLHVRTKNEPDFGHSVEVKPDGTFACHFAPGEVTLIADIRSGSLLEDQKTLTLVTGQDQTDLVFEVIPPLMFKGRVLGTDGKPIAGAKVFTKWGGNEKPILSNQEGFFEYPSPPGLNFKYVMSFFLEATHPDKPGLRGQLAKPISSEDDLKGDIVLTPVGTIRGKVLDKEGKPVPNTKVLTTIVSENNVCINDREADCDATGLFEIKDAVGSVNYSVTATADKYGQAKTSKTVVEPGKTWDIGTLVLPVADKFIEGTVKDKEGKPVAGVDINGWAEKTGHRNTQSDGKGHFKLENIVAEETVRINVWHNGQKGQLYADVSAKAGTTDVELKLMAESRRALLDDNQPISLVGKEAPALEVAAWIAGEAATLESLRGAPVVLAFCKSDDKASEELVAVLNKICEKFPKIPVLAVCNADADQVALRKSIVDLGVKFRVAIDKPVSKTGATTDKYRAHITAVYLIGADGKVQYQDLTFPVIEKTLQSMIDGK